ncbi:hypothetical protein AwDysgo_10810 [Bacteroidales bacterium]|nr:hypothetical protein AwDysgo_10810 [Bacteroidales bacterium]
MRKLTLLLFAVLISLSSYSQAKNPAQQFFEALSQHCGNAYEGLVTAGAGNDAFDNKKLIMHVRSCEKNTIRIPFFVGDDKSRTWVLKLKKDRILLKHDHRHEDGSEDKVTQYGGWTSNMGSDTLQMFPADEQTRALIPHAANNVWWITIDQTSFTYNLRRIGSERLFTVTFDLSKKVETPSAPW